MQLSANLGLEELNCQKRRSLKTKLKILKKLTIPIHGDFLEDEK